MYKRILVAIDGSETSEHAFDTALQLARDNDAQLQPLYVVDNPLMAYDASGYDPTILHDAFVEEGQRLLADALARMTRTWPARRGLSMSHQSARTFRSESAPQRTNSTPTCWCLARTGGEVSSVCFLAAWPNASCEVQACRCCWCRAGKRKTQSRMRPNQARPNSPRRRANCPANGGPCMSMA